MAGHDELDVGRHDIPPSLNHIRPHQAVCDASIAESGAGHELYD